MQRILLAKALLKPRFLIIDETLSGVSTIMRKKYYQELKENLETSVIMILHGYKTEMNI